MEIITRAGERLVAKVTWESGRGVRRYVAVSSRRLDTAVSTKLKALSPAEGRGGYSSSHGYPLPLSGIRFPVSEVSVCRHLTRPLRPPSRLPPPETPCRAVAPGTPKRCEGGLAKAGHRRRLSQPVALSINQSAQPAF
jgi:hypothetical protein